MNNPWIKENKTPIVGNKPELYRQSKPFRQTIVNKWKKTGILDSVLPKYHNDLACLLESQRLWNEARPSSPFKKISIGLCKRVFLACSRRQLFLKSPPCPEKIWHGSLHLNTHGPRVEIPWDRDPCKVLMEAQRGIPYTLAEESVRTDILAERIADEFVLLLPPQNTFYFFGFDWYDNDLKMFYHIGLGVEK